MILLYAVIAFVLATALTWWLCRPGARWSTLDYPNERSLHSRPTPRGGGLAILSGIYLTGIAIAFALPPTLTVLVVGASGLAIAAVSFLDDRLQVAPLWRVLVHLGAGVALTTAGLGLTRLDLPGLDQKLPLLIGAPITVLFVVWMVNLYNFMDGIDGLAGGMAVIGFSSFALFGVLAGNTPFAAISLSAVAATFGFLIFNFPPARIFMGDVGSSTLGFLAAALALWGQRDGIVPLWAALLIFSPFIVDASVTLLQRASRGEKLWQAHKRHYYQRLVQLGWGHTKTVLWEYGLMLACAASALWAARQTPAAAWFILALWAFSYPVLMLQVARLERIKRSTESPLDTEQNDSER